MAPHPRPLSAGRGEKNVQAYNTEGVILLITPYKRSAVRGNRHPFSPLLRRGAGGEDGYIAKKSVVLAGPGREDRLVRRFRFAPSTVNKRSSLRDFFSFLLYKPVMESKA
jgi:hypothetical protein